MVAECDFAAAQFFCHAVKHAAAQAAAQRAGGFALFNHPLHHGISVFFDDVVGHADALQIFGQNMLGKARLLLVEVDGHQLEINRRAGLKLAQNIQKRIAVFAARETHHDFVAGFNHVEIIDGIAHGMAQALV